MFEYICKSKPQEAKTVAQRYSNVLVNDSGTALKVFVYVMKNADEATKTALLTDLREIHPDSDLYRDENGVGFWTKGTMDYPLLVPKDVDTTTILPVKQTDLPLPVTPTMNATGGCGCGCGGTKMYNATGSGTETKTDSAVQELKTESLIRKNLLNIVIIVVLVAVVYKIFIKKA